ncbi:MAG: hypothetical protein JWN34_4751 [Bryobacterales bacterium]|nr:hypothetical protein [Bryobacterales bacterium]
MAIPSRPCQPVENEMDPQEIISQLRERHANVTAAIVAFERVEAGGGPKRGRPRKPMIELAPIAKTAKKQ